MLKKTLLICELALEITECNNIMNCCLFHLLLYNHDYKKPVELYCRYYCWILATIRLKFYISFLFFPLPIDTELDFVKALQYIISISKSNLFLFIFVTL